ncbi:hypothetical protein LDL08_38630 [Nonomuraea glycinis]|uniref:Uncharacterized protein n=1 Tax=Nonomuraea glycinis TaxID=2047744 RepID=A0A918A1G9_9ACTN|nr:hypothetical protein [Nonomuraea glycinis]MCA2182096.1 hypothetical protein [Nonomuraea glycinis]GGP02311.1 hypothetical protein GCM10012278_09040 [Nonomuraea glycinis]
MDEFDLDHFVSLEELMGRGREFIWTTLPYAREVVRKLEAEYMEDGLYVSTFEYLLEIMVEVFDPAVENAEEEILDAFFEMCEGLLALHSGLIEEHVEGFVAKGLVVRHPDLIARNGPRLMRLISENYII